MATAEEARRLNCYRLSWHAANSNLVARKLYDAVATTENVQYRMHLETP